MSQPILVTRPRPLGQARGYASSSKLDGAEYQRLYTELPFYGFLGMPTRSVRFRRSVSNLAGLIQVRRWCSISNGNMSSNSSCW